MPEDQFVKVLFRYFSDVRGEVTVETMWAIPVDASAGLYKLDSIPFYGPPVATDDIFFAEWDEDEQMLIFREVREESGNSIVQVLILSETYDAAALRAEFSEMGCVSEGMNDKYFSMEVPSALDYADIRRRLEELAEAEHIGFAEPVLSERHAL
ncbi:MAG: DUF4265 domain-containing protein [Chitinophagaceae bacterium]|nr:MAG: DUF4265 domain-containing protein [Chitinophagaceae bacterium]